MNETKSFAISKNFTVDLNTRRVFDKRNGQILLYDDINTKVLIYEDRQKTWFFDIANYLKSINEAGFIILMIATSYLESNQQYREGKSSYKKSVKFIDNSLKRIFPEFDKGIRKRVIDGVRHGLFHDGITKGGIFISGDLQDVLIKGRVNITINPYLFLDRIKKDFEDYIDILKNEENIKERENFEQFIDALKKI